MANDWLLSLVDDVFACLISDVKGRMSPLSYKTFAPDENGIGTWLVHIAPSNGELVGGKDDGEEIFDPVDVDLLELPRILDEVESFTFDPGNSFEDPHIWLSGQKNGEEVTIQIYLYPFDEEDPSWSVDINRGKWSASPEEPGASDD